LKGFQRQFQNGIFERWFAPELSQQLQQLLPGHKISTIIRRIQKRGYYIIQAANPEPKAFQPLVYEFALSLGTISGVEYLVLNVHDLSVLSEKEAMVQSHSNMVEKNNRVLHDKAQLLKEKNDQLSVLSTKLAKYLSPQVYAQLFNANEAVEIKTRRRHLSMFFCDLVGFTAFSERAEPEQIEYLLNNYLGEISRIAHEHGGTVDKFMGDGIMIFFGDPDSQGEKEDAIACVTMANSIRDHFPNLQKLWCDFGICQTLDIRMGINSGYCTVGNFGGDAQLDYTAVGSNVNLASRLESAATPGDIYLSHATYRLVKGDVNCHSKGEVTVKGGQNPVPVYAVTKTGSQVIIQKKIPGFSLDIDLAEVNKAQLVDILHETLEALSGS